MSDHTGIATDTISKKKVKLKHPKEYKVFLLNDDYTTMDFVIEVLEVVFKKQPAEAFQIMLHVHRRGQGLAGVYSKEIAEAKIDKVHTMARESGYPLRCTLEES